MTPDGRRAISASTDNTLKVWNLDTGRAEQTFPGHKDRVFDLAPASDGRRVVSAALNDWTLKVWNPDTGQEDHTLVGHEHSVTAVAVTPDGRRAVSASRDRTLKVWNLDTGQEICSITLEAGPHCVALAAAAVEPTTDHLTKGFAVITGDAAGNVYCFDFFEPSPLPDPQ